jgi:hypothetical protein
MALYEQLDDTTFRSTTATRGPWSVDHQHAGPPAALLGGLLERALGPGRVVRITFEILRPVLITDLTAQVAVTRPGAKVALAEGHLADADGPVLLARAWRLRTGDVGVAGDAPDLDGPLPPRPDEGVAGGFFEVDWDEGYHRSIETRFNAGSFAELGDAFAWFRLLVPVVAGEEPTPLQRVLVAADSGNGISARFDPREVLFVNTELSVHLREHPADEWVGLDAATRFAGDGVGLATSTIHGTQGPIGRGAQALIVERR